MNMKINGKGDAFRMDVITANGIPFRVILWPDKKDYKDRPVGLVEVFDLRYAHGNDGQFTGACTYVPDLVGTDRGETLDHPWRVGWDLHGGVDSWKIDADTMFLVRLWITGIMRAYGTVTVDGP